LLEKVYEACLCHELAKRELKYQRQVDIPITYDGMIFDEGWYQENYNMTFVALCLCG